MTEHKDSRERGPLRPLFSVQESLVFKSSGNQSSPVMTNAVEGAVSHDGILSLLSWNLFVENPRHLSGFLSLRLIVIRPVTTLLVLCK